MKNNFISGIEQWSREEQSAFQELVELALSVYHRYAWLLSNKEFRSLIIAQVPDIESLFIMLYEKKLVSWKDISLWLRNRLLYSTVLVGKTSSPSVVVWALNDTTIQLQWDDQIGLLLSREGNIYKRSLDKDVEKLLK